MKNERPFQIVAHTVMILFSMVCLMPFLLLLMSSFSAEKDIVTYGYSLFPRALTLDAYVYIWLSRASIGRAYLMTFLSTAVGTSSSLILCLLLAYPISRNDFPWRRAYSLFIFITLLFNGGLVPTYLVYVNGFALRNTFWALVIPNLMLSGFHVLIMRSYFTTTIPFSVVESATIDGANEVQILLHVVIPLSLPILATVGMLVGINYWNDWFNGMVYITNSKLYSIQNLLNRIISDIEFLTTIGADSGSSAAMAAIPAASVRMALAVVGVVPIFAIYPFFQRFFVKGIAVGAVKG